MGVDSIELVLEVEEHFSIKIPDKDASKFETVGALYDYVVEHTSIVTSSSTCLSAATFYALRRATRALGFRGRLRPRDSTANVLPDVEQREYWSQLQKLSNLKLPDLERPFWLVTICALLVVAVSGLVAAIVMLLTQSALYCLVSLCVAFIVARLIAEMATLRYAVDLAENCLTLRTLSESALAMNFQTLSDRYNGANKQDVWVALRSIVAEQLALSVDDVKPNSHFINDLGM